jgi:hypothetical protein
VRAGTVGFISAQARLWAARQGHKKRYANKVREKNQARYSEKMANPMYSVADYDVPPEDDLMNIDPNTQEFRQLDFLTKIRILRQRKNRS